jgi:hypothetical protein
MKKKHEKSKSQIQLNFDDKTSYHNESNVHQAKSTCQGATKIIKMNHRKEIYQSILNRKMQ